MNRNDTLLNDASHRTLAVDERPQALRLPAGSALFALAGEVWLTQDGHVEDTILAAGARHDLRGRGTVVVSATGRAPALLYLAAPAEAAAIDGSDLHGYLRRRAQALRRQEVDRISHALAHGTRGLLARLRRLVAREPAAPLPQGRHGAAT